MEHKNIVASGLVLLLVIVGMFVYAYLKKNEIKNSVNAPIITVQEDPTSPYGNIVSIEATHFFSEGVHTLIGEIEMPTPCDLLSWETRVMESFPEQVIIDFSVVNHSEMCAQMIAPQRFKVSFSASENAVLRATLEKREVRLNRMPGDPNINPDDFELFIKG